MNESHPLMLVVQTFVISENLIFELNLN